MDKHKICTTCPIPHYEDCSGCLGFGIRERIDDGEIVPITADEAMGDTPLPDWEVCLVCGSGAMGLSYLIDPARRMGVKFTEREKHLIRRLYEEEGE